MLKNLITIPAILLLVLVAGQSPAEALDTNDGALGFIPADATIVMALDMNEVYDYAGDVGDTWRDADVARFSDGLDTLSEIITVKTGKPDIFTFFGHLDGVQAFYFDPAMEYPMMVFSAENPGELDVLAGYLVSYLLEMKYKSGLDEIEDALDLYHNRTVTDKETGEDTWPWDYPETLDDLIETGYLEEIPTNPFTMAPMVFMEEGQDGSLGDVLYVPVEDCCADDGDTVMYTSYKLQSYHVSGILTQQPWNNDFESYDDTAERVKDILDDFEAVDHASLLVSENGYRFFGSPGNDYAFAYGDKYLLFGDSVDSLKDAVRRQRSGRGFEFDRVDGFNTEGAFYLEQIDLPAIMDEYGTPPMMVWDMMGPPMMGAPKGDVMDMLEGIYSKMGFEKLGKKYQACWLENDDIRSVERTMLTDQAEGTMLDRILSSEPEQLLTAEGGPFGIIGEVAWANQTDFLQAYIDFLMQTLVPILSEKMGGGMDMDPNMMLGMLGMGDINEMDFGDQAYILLTESELRSNGEYIPGLTTIVKTSNEDLGYIAVGVMDSLSFMVPEFPFVQMESDMDNVHTWVLDNDELPLSPTIGWTRGWLVKGLWREDVLKAIDAIENGSMFIPDMMEPANARIHFNRQELLRGVADVAYLVPEDEAKLYAGMFELCATLSNPDERLYCETTMQDDYVETRSMFSIGMFEDLAPLLSYVIQGTDAMH